MSYLYESLDCAKEMIIVARGGIEEVHVIIEIDR